MPSKWKAKEMSTLRAIESKVMCTLEAIPAVQSGHSPQFRLLHTFVASTSDFFFPPSLGSDILVESVSKFKTLRSFKKSQV